MSSLIDTDEIKRQWGIYGSLDIMDRILADVFPTVDAVPVIHAEWEEDYPLCHCTNCRHTIMCHDKMDLAEYHRYCGRCGAMMSM